MDVEVKSKKDEFIENRKNHDDDIEILNVKNTIEYDFTNIPHQITGCWTNFRNKEINNYTTGCKWAPDGSYILSSTMDTLSVFNLPAEICNFSSWYEMSEMIPFLKINLHAKVTAYSWYPNMKSYKASTCCFVSAVKKQPVQLWNICTKKLQASYRYINQLDEEESPYSLCFDTNGEHIFSSFKNKVVIFDVNKPGRHFTERHISDNHDSVSCFSFSRAKNLYAAGTYSGKTALYDETNREMIQLFKEHKNAIIDIKFSPDGRYLFTGAQKDPRILYWDVRQTITPIEILERPYNSRSKIFFDLSSCGKYIASGASNCKIIFWDISKGVQHIHTPILRPIQTYSAHNDCVNGVSFHPSKPLLISSSGEEKIPVSIDSEDESTENECNPPFSIPKRDNSLRLWWVGKMKY